MVSRSVLTACGCAVLLSLACQARSNSQSSPSPTPEQQPTTSAPAQPAGSGPAQPAVPSLQLKDLPAEPHTPTAAELVEQRRAQAMAAAQRLASVQAHWGPDMSTPGLSISLTEVGREKEPDGTTKITYHITGSGFAPGERLSLIRWPLNSEAQTVMGDLTLDASGTAVCTAPSPAEPTTAGGSNPATPAPPSCSVNTHPGDPILLRTTAAPGEPIRVALVGADRKHGAATTAIPFPLVSEDKSCRLSVILGMKDAAMVLVEGTGFPPNTPLKLESVTGGNSRMLTPTSNADGRIVIVVLPASQGADAGDTTVRFAGINRLPTLQTSSTPPQPDLGCKPAVTFHWGKGSYKLD